VANVSGAGPAAKGLRYRPENWWWRQGPVEPGAAVVFDMDGVLSDAATRQHYIEGPRQDWHRFFEACGEDLPVAEVATLLHLLDPALQVVLLTARPSRVQPQTLAWLERYGLRWDLLIMRDYGDYSAAREFKQYSVFELRQYGFELQLAFEDDRRNLAMFHREGIPCVYIHSGYFD
jgi:phosphoglycolate phosphatase-like HAD superfamily hydrolase